MLQLSTRLRSHSELVRGVGIAALLTIVLFIGLDSFTYEVTDQNGQSDTATVFVVVHPEL